MKKTIFAASIATAVSLASFNTYAADIGGYVGASFGKTTSDALDDLNDIPGVSVDDSDTGYKLFAGYNFNANFAVEGFYADLGEISATDGVYKFSVDTDSLGVAILGKLPVGEKAEVFAKVGYQRWGAKLSENGTKIADDDGSDVIYGIGAAYNINNVSIRAEFERFALDNEDVNLLSLGLAYNF